MIPLKDALLVSAIVDPEVSQYQLQTVVKMLAQNGVRYIQYRDKKNTDLERFKIAKSLKAICKKQGAYFFINDRVDIAMLVEADGVHLGPHDLPVSDVKTLAPNLLIGASSGDVAYAKRCEREGADYLGVGALFDAKATKPNASDPRGLDIVKQVYENISIPFVGIGGISINNAKSVITAGASGVAMARAISTESADKNIAQIVSILQS